METVTLKYNDGTAKSRVMSVLRVRGWDSPDEWEYFPRLQYELVDGSITEYIRGYRRVFTIEFAILDSSTDAAFIFEWMRDTARSIVYLGQELSVVIEHVNGYSNEWIDGVRIAKRYVVRCKEKTLQTGKTFVGAGYGFDYGGSYGDTL